MAYDFTTLSPADFEDLCRDLVGREIGIQFEAFTPGPDGGIDGRHALSTKSTILQVKHLVGSHFAKLKSTMKGERASIDKLEPDRYILATSRGLTPANKEALAAEIGPALRNQGDIYGASELNALLRKFPDIEKSHIKLWLSGTAVLERVLWSAAHTFTELSKSEIEGKVRVYAHNPSFPAAQKILESQHVLIISGPPGVGKTTLAEMLVYTYLAEGWELVAVRALEDGFGTIDDAKKQVFLFDDFLGKIALDEQALAAKDSDLARFMRRVRTSPNARFLLTTRAYIFEEARRASEYLADQRLDISRYLLDVGVYTRRIRARILYNHLLIAGTPMPLVRALIETGAVKSIVDHRNYNPRVIEWMTDADRLHGKTPEAYPASFITALDNPSQLWDTAFRKHIPDKCRHLLLTMYFCSEYGVELDELRTQYEALHRDLSAKYGTARDPKDFEESVRILEGGFITLRGTHVSYVNPSFRDYMSGYVNDAALLADCAAAAQTANWADKVWKSVHSAPLPPKQRRHVATSFREISTQFLDLPTWKKTSRHSYSCADLDNVRRLQLLLAWWTETGDHHFSELVMKLAQHPPAPRGWSGYSGWREGAELIDLTGKLRDEDYFSDFPFADDLANLLEDDIVELLEHGMAFDELEGMLEAVEDAYPAASQRIQEAAHAAIRREIYEVEVSISDLDSESALEDYAETLEKFASRASVPPDALVRALSKVKDRIDEIAEWTSVASSPSPRSTPRESDSFDDAALASLFVSLLRKG
ncbi:hypothetical protein [Pseudohoeflea coraliihabitans]|uniref:AAA+ ATPase domain-containing protein n=1 Tax=Pseudohoeflea coraliihabitans TaxID=2860393 RepID=A0ABS6WMH1_9HYPH|nr:hypothetical protein [Pseudohoeflea sp. DP4N28-3]MBW3097148.1 hypothetical protein [Pseudohoeflea sp. DP4N28-3]